MRKILVTSVRLLALTVMTAALGVPAAGAAPPTPIASCGETITLSGSYLVSGDLTAATGVPCITVATKNVIIDLGGHTLTGDRSADGITDGGVPHSGIIVRNGILAAFERGIDLLSSTGSQVRNVTAVENASDGIALGTHSVVTGCTARDNGGDGVVLGDVGLADFSQVSGCTIIGNTGNGIVAGSYTQVTGNIVNESRADGISAGAFSIVVNNTAVGNHSTGIVAGVHSQISGNTESDSAVRGIAYSCPSVVTNNTATGNGFFDYFPPGGGAGCIFKGNK